MGDRRGPRHGYEYRFATRALRSTHNLGRLKLAIGLLCMSMTVLGFVTSMHPMGPHGFWPRLIEATASLSALVVGICWIALPWPSRRWARAFVFWADITSIASALTLSTPVSRLGATNHLALIGVFAAFMLGWRVLAAHCIFAATSIAGITLWNTYIDGTTLFEQYIYNAPAFSNVVLLPIVIQTVIEGGRRALWKITSAAHRDPLTGMLNRRGLQVTIEYKRHTRSWPAVIAVAVVDIDHFKELNDSHGHGVGDTTLNAVAKMLLTNTGENAVIARIGGDEFMVVKFLDNDDGVGDFVQSVNNSRSLSDVPHVTLSVGTAWGFTDDPNFSFQSLSREADYSMYEVKRTRSGPQQQLA